MTTLLESKLEQTAVEAEAERKQGSEVQHPIVRIEFHCALLCFVILTFLCFVKISRSRVEELKTFGGGIQCNSTDVRF